VAPKHKKVVATEVDFLAEASAVAVSTKPILKDIDMGPGPVAPVVQSCVLVAPAAVGLAMSDSDADMRQKVARVQAEAQLPRLVSGPEQKDNVLENYQNQFGSGKVIVTSFQGKPPTLNLQPPSQHHLMKSCSMKPDKNESYGVRDPTVSNVLVFLVEKYLTSAEISILSATNKLFAKVIPEIKRLLKLDRRPIVEGRPDYNDQTQISTDRIDMSTALALRCGLDP